MCECLSSLPHITHITSTYLIISTYHDWTALSLFLYNPATLSLFALLSRMNSDTVDYDDSCLIVRYLASMRPFAQSFDIYLTQVRFEYF